MGGSGSGNHYHWWRPTKKTTVEACLSIDASRWTRDGVLRAGVHASGSWRWTYESGESFCVHYVVETADPARPTVRLFYSLRWGEGEPLSADYRLPLAATRPRFGGLRWWFICPLILGGRHCGRRVGKLYLPPGGCYFGCRRCHHLTYESVQRHDARVDALRKDPAEIERILDDAAENPLNSRLLLALKALG